MVEFTVTVPAGTGGGYYIDGVQKPIVPVVTGGTFRFNQDAASNNGHPLILSTTTSTAGIISTGVVYYLDGISNSTDYRNTTLFNAATVRYIEITVSQTTDFYYICNVHGSGMGNVMDITTDTWSALFWGAGGWEQQGDSFTDVTGVQISTEEGDVYSGQPGGWGQFTWGFGEWGDTLNPNVDVTGFQLNTSVGNEEAFTDISITLSTNLITLSTDTVTLIAGSLAEPTSVLINTTTGTVFAGENVIVEVVTPGTATTWGENAWGVGAWNQITGTLSQTGEESVIGTTGVNLIGNLLNTSTGTFTVIADANLLLNTNIISSNIGDVSIVGGVFVEVTSPGNLPWGTTSWNYGSWGNIGGMDVEQGGEEVVVPSVEVDVIGNQLNTTIGTYSITADANLTAITNLLTISLGNEESDANTIVSVSTNLLNASVGIASGEVLSTVDLIGVNMTTSTGRLFITAWAVVDIGVTNNWAVVDIAA